MGTLYKNIVAFGTLYSLASYSKYKLELWVLAKYY